MMHFAVIAGVVLASILAIYLWARHTARKEMVGERARDDLDEFVRGSRKIKKIQEEHDAKTKLLFKSSDIRDIDDAGGLRVRARHNHRFIKKCSPNCPVYKH